MPENPFNKLRDQNRSKSKPEFSFNNAVTETNRELINECASIAINEAAKNNEFLPFIFDTFGGTKDVDLSEIERLLSKYKGVECDLVDKVKVSNNYTGFQTASGNKIEARENRENSTKESDALRERILSEVVHANLDLTWDDIVGLEKVKQSINEIVLWPLMRPDIFTGLRNPPKGLLLFGPPGTGKTMIGKCIASQVKATFFSISASSLTSKWVGEGERMVRTLFEMAREMAPSIIFVDEIDALLSQRQDNENEGSRRIKTEFLVQFDGAKVEDKEQILVIGATNRPHEIDDAARRRLVKRIYVPLPCADARKQMIHNLVSKFKNDLGGHEEVLVAMTEGYSGSDMFNLCREACFEPLREISDIKEFNAESSRPITVDDFHKAVTQIRKSVSEKDLLIYKQFDKEFGSNH